MLNPHALLLRACCCVSSAGSLSSCVTHDDNSDGSICGLWCCCVQVLLVFSSQGMGTLVNASVILISMAIFGQTGQQSDMTVSGCQKVLALTYGFGAVCCLVMVVYRFVYLGESEVSYVMTCTAIYHAQLLYCGKLLDPTAVHRCVGHQCTSRASF